MDTNITLNTIAEKRDFLRQISNSVSEAVKNEQYGSINEAIVDVFYKDKIHTEFKTFNEWQANGYKIKKGSKAFLVWGKPVRKQEADKAEAKGTETATEEDILKDFFPLAFVFSNAQVERRPIND